MNTLKTITNPYKIAKYIIYLSYIYFIYDAYEAYRSPSFENFLGLALTLLAELSGLYLAQRQIQLEEKKASSREPQQESERTLNLKDQFDYGVVGGFLGGLIAGVIYGYLYYKSSFGLVGPDRIIHITIFSALVGALMSASIQIGINYFNSLHFRLNYPRIIFNEVLGGFIASFTGALISGTIGGIYFWSLGGPAIGDLASMKEFIGCGLLGSTIMTFGIMYFDYRWAFKRIFRLLIILAIITAIIWFFSILILFISNINLYFETQIPSTENIILALTGGVILGLVLGGGMGLQIGATILFYRKWEGIKYVRN